MPRKIVPLVTEETYHIFNRGVDKRPVFLDTQDYLRFYNSLHYFNSIKPVSSLFESSRNAKLNPGKPIEKLVRIHAYSLLPNHFHLMLTQVTDGGISEFMKRVGGGYTSYFNEKNKRSGSLFQGTYKRVGVTSNAQLLFLAAYINFNHQVHTNTEAKELYKTSKEIYSGTKKNIFLSTDIILKQYLNNTEYIKDATALAKLIFEQRNGIKSADYETLALE